MNIRTVYPTLKIMPVDVNRDELTGLYNRRYLREYAKQEIKRARRYKSSFSILILDLDDFKEINDTKGHLTGDEALKRFSSIIQTVIRESDIPTRYGGDEFVILLPDTSYKGAYRLAERIIEKVSKEEIKGMDLSCSIGIATFPDDGVIWEELFEQADRSLYSAKRAGKGRIGTKSARIVSLKIPLPIPVGRRQETTKVLQFLNEPGKLHIVVGEAGIGKTRLVTHAIKSTNDTLVLKGTASGAIVNIPYYTIREVLKGIYFSHQPLFEKTLSQLSEILKRELIKLTPFYQVQQTEFVSSSPDKYTLYEAISRFFNFLSIKGKTILYIDDFHWIDTESAELLYYLIKTAPDIVYMATMRNDEVKGTKAEEIIGILGRERLYDTLELPPLSSSETKQMVSGILGGEISDDFFNFVYSESGGNPFFIEEIIRTLHDGNKLILEKETWNIQKEVDIIPKTIEDTVKHRLQNLSQDIYNILEYLSVIHNDIDPELVANITGYNEGEIYDVLDALTRKLILTNIDDRYYRFKEGIIRDVILHSISQGKLRMLHRKVGSAIETLFAKNLNEHYEELALHFSEGGVKDKTLFYSEKSGDKAMSVYAYEKAVKYYSKAIESSENEEDTKRLRLKIAKAFEGLSDFESAIENYRKAYELASSKERSDIAQRIGDSFSAMGMSNEALSWYKKAYDEAYPEYKKYIYMLDMAWEYHQNGQPSKALNMVKEALANIPESEIEALGTAHNILGAIYMNQAKYEEAEKHFKKSIEYREKTNNKKALAGSHNNLGILYDNMQRYDMVLKHYNIALNLYREIGFKEGIGIMTYNIGLLYNALGDFDRALKHLKEAKETFELIRAMYSLALVYNNLAMLYETLGLYSKVMPLLQKSLNISDEIKHDYTRFDTLLSMFNFMGSQKKYDEARKLIPEFLAFEEKYKGEPSLIYLYDSLSQFYEETGDIERATEYALKSFNITVDLNVDPGDRSYCINYYILARLYALKNDKKKAMHYLKLAEKHPYNEKVKKLPEISQAYFLKTKGYTYLALGEREKAINLLQKALKIFEKKNHVKYIEEITEILSKLSKNKSPE